MTNHYSVGRTNKEPIDIQFKGCGHNKLYSERCIKCEKVTALEGIKFAKREIAKWEARLEELKREKLSHSS